MQLLSLGFVNNITLRDVCPVAVKMFNVDPMMGLVNAPNFLLGGTYNR